MDAVAAWEAHGAHQAVRGHRIFVVDRRAGREEAEPLLILHGFPCSSFDWRHVLARLAARRRVILPDFLGFGLSDKPDRRYSLSEQADVVEAIADALGLGSAAMMTHDMGDSVGGELLARSLAGTLGFEITRRVITNGSIYMDLVQLSPGQQLLLDLPDALLAEDEAIGADLFKPSLAATFGAQTQPGEEELDAQWRLLARAGGDRLLPRLIRYVEERRVHESRWTGGIERHASPLTIVWGDVDPIAVFPMAERLHARRPDAQLVRMEGIGHFPMIEVPGPFADAAEAALS